MKFAGVATIAKSDVHAKCEGQKSKVKVAEGKKTNFSPIWKFPDRNSSLNSHVAMKWCTKLEVT